MKINLNTRIQDKTTNKQFDFPEKIYTHSKNVIETNKDQW